MTFKAAVIQDSPVLFNLKLTIDKVETLTKEASRNGASLVVFPEAFISAYPKGLIFGAKIGSRTIKGRKEFLQYYNSSLDLKGSEFRKLLNIAKNNKVFLVIGVIEKSLGTLYCTILHISEKGSLLCKHRKVMPTAAERLIWGFGDGSTLETAKTRLGVLGSVICWENYMPMMRMSMYDQGIELYCAPTADDRETWISTVKHIALEGRCFVFSSCQFFTKADYPSEFDISNIVGDEPIMKGGSCIISPLGKVLASAGDKKRAIIYSEINLDEIIQGKYDFDVVGHYSRPDIFKLKVNKKSKKPVI